MATNSISEKSKFHASRYIDITTSVGATVAHTNTSYLFLCVRAEEKYYPAESVHFTLTMNVKGVFIGKNVQLCKMMLAYCLMPGFWMVLMSQKTDKQRRNGQSIGSSYTGHFGAKINASTAAKPCCNNFIGHCEVWDLHILLDPTSLLHKVWASS